MRAFVVAVAVWIAVAPGACAAEAAGAPDLHRPVRGPILRHFEAPPGPYAAGHRGIDMGAARGTLVRAAAPGTVAFAGRIGGDLFVSIDHGDGYRTTYSFLDAVLADEDAVVAAGDPIARSGPGHEMEEPHLHFGLKRFDEYLDPEPVLLAGMRADLTRVVRLVE